MAYAVDSTKAWLLVDTVTSARQRRVKNDGPGTAYLSRNPLEQTTDASAFAVAASSEETVWLEEGDRLYARCAAGVTASLEVI